MLWDGGYGKTLPAAAAAAVPPVRESSCFAAPAGSVSGSPANPSAAAAAAAG